ncbi:MAG TPA: SDR family NAD(P)-dependent oxidoreductase [Acidimicrobiia bacterium]|nr:SDR family NAD(P)-dependent oxidoreductase [Acidimicrobiia bacterium]
MADIADRSILVIGATGALGSRIARRLHERGAMLTLVGRDEGRLAGLGLPGRLVRADLRYPADCRRMVADALDEHQRLDGVVNAAGVVAFGAVADLDDAALDELFATDVLGPLRVVREALPHLGQGSFVVQISGVVAEQPVAGMAAYSAAKAALASATAALAREVRRAGISVIDVQPPHTETGLATRPIAGTAPPFPEGLDPDLVAGRIVAAIEAGERLVPASAF